LYIVGCRKFLFPREYQRKKSQKLTKTPFLCEGSHMKHVGIALSGGGVAGCAHLGVLYGLEKADISVGYIAGTSAGAIVASLYAYG
jgi:predicted acylesterase/phospholipase RssA